MANVNNDMIKVLIRATKDGMSFLVYLCTIMRKRKGPVTLVYHSVGRVDPSKDIYRLNITPERFEEHLKIISSMKEDVRITFDDGYGNNFENAFPLLVKYGCKATIFIITDFIDGRIGSDRFCGEGLDLRPLTWEEIKIMDKSGIAFGSHTRTHPALSGLSTEALNIELSGSKDRIESSLDHAIDSLAYPFGGRASFNAGVEASAAEAGYKFAYTNIMGINRDGIENHFRLRRVRVYGEDGPFKLKMKLRGAYDWVDAFL